MTVAEQHSVRVDRRLTPFDIGGVALDAVAELHEAVFAEDVQAQISSLRRLVAIGGLAQVLANRMETGQ